MREILPTNLDQNKNKTSHSAPEVSKQGRHHFFSFCLCKTWFDKMFENQIAEIYEKCFDWLYSDFSCRLSNIDVLNVFSQFLKKMSKFRGRGRGGKHPHGLKGSQKCSWKKLLFKYCLNQNTNQLLIFWWNRIWLQVETSECFTQIDKKKRRN